MAELKLPKVIKHIKVLELFSKAKSPRDKILLETIYYCGLRVSESINLKRENIDLKDNFITVISGKGKKDRLIPIPKPLLNDLKMWLNLKDLNEEDKIFPINRSRVHQIVKSLDKNIHTHTLRHSYGTYLYEKGIDLRGIAELMGHSNIETTKIYTHLSKEHKKKIIDKVFE